MDVTTSAAQLSPDYHSLFDAVVSQPSGVELLRKGNLESVAVLFGAHPVVVDRVRGWMDCKAQRKVLAEALLRARSRRPTASAAPSPVAPPPQPPGTPEELLRAALEVPGGDEFLVEAPLETVAIVFGVHPSLVTQARELQAPSAQA